ncbi:hypothetical protein N7676_12050 [Stenotrophomonas sp. GD03993]|uniref:hypothetical protein n=1 Tax=unclassified Stenotrophomonas TaxID=196198 RepID=UPI0018D3AF0D|nr:MULTISPECIES: hypothetical protein [unclassified Stenotrophomonas]MBH1461132.1 hypothetical protein [Stenotrophomonas maltophilia]MDH0188921.1 hypothetical protein [Stenotrophomonas sp. GD04051]MDH0464544.1 hypothetical protein [Stenotrophomonas sp. GD03993]MDH0877050.1 hypothetical protein [Stenotrophomonas sp. GD03877]MDH2157941.1 hypothetical protein [Stenotrophomonas sp. GD03657]
MQVSSFPATCMVRGRGFRELHEDDGPHQGSGDGGGGNGGGGDRRSRTARSSGGDQAGVGGIKNHGVQKTLRAGRLSSAAMQKFAAAIIGQRADIWLQLRPNLHQHP